MSFDLHIAFAWAEALVLPIVFIEALLALGAMTGRRVEPKDVRRGLRADSLGTLIGRLFNTLPYVSYSGNIGLIGVYR